MPGVQKPHCEPCSSGHRRLHRMQLAVIGEIFDGDQFGAIKLAEQRDARIDRLIDQAAAMLAHDHR